MSKAAEIRSQIRELVRADRKIEAVKLFRDMTWTSLLEAKLAVEAIAEGRSPERDIDWLDELDRAIADADFETSVRLLAAHTSLDEPEAEKQIRRLFSQYISVSSPIDDQDLHEKIVYLLKVGRKLEAVKLFKEYTSLGLLESKEAVEQIEQRLRAEATQPSAQQVSVSADAEVRSNTLNRFTRLMAFIYALICAIGFAILIGLSVGQPTAVKLCQVSEDLLPDEQLAELLRWKSENIPSTTDSFFLNDRFLDYRFEPDLPARYPFLEGTWNAKLTRLTEGAKRAVYAFWRCVIVFGILYGAGIAFAVWGCLRPGFLNSISMLSIGCIGYPNVAELPLRFHCDHAAWWFVPLMASAGLMLICVFFGRGFQAAKFNNSSQTNL